MPIKVAGHTDPPLYSSHPNPPTTASVHPYVVSCDLTLNLGNDQPHHALYPLRPPPSVPYLHSRTAKWTCYFIVTDYHKRGVIFLFASMVTAWSNVGSQCSVLADHWNMLTGHFASFISSGYVIRTLLGEHLVSLYFCLIIQCCMRA